jgi:hypothetical protein
MVPPGAERTELVYRMMAMCFNHNTTIFNETEDCIPNIKLHFSNIMEKLIPLMTTFL